MSFSSQSSIYASSVSDKDDCSSVSDVQVSQLQAEILQQSKVIEQFIKKSSKNDDSASFSVLKSLFVLFKSELSVNLKLRTILVDERNKYSNLNDQINYFFHSLHKAGFNDFRDFESILNFIIGQDKYYHDVQKSVIKSIKKEKHKNKLLQSQISDLKKVGSLNVEFNDEKEKEIIKNTEQISQLEKNNQFLNNTIQDKEKVIDSLKQEIEAKRKEIDEKIKEIDEKRNDNEKKSTTIMNLQKEIQALKTSNQSKSNENANKYMLIQIHTLQKENEFLKNCQKEIQIQKEKEIMELNGQNIIDIENIKSECSQKCNEILIEKEKAENQYKTEMEDMKRCNNQLKQQVTDLYQTNEKQKKETDQMKIQINEIENNSNELKQINSSLYLKLRKMKNKLKNFHKSCIEITKNHQIEINQIKEEYDSQLKSSISQVELGIKDKIEKSESENKQLRITIEEQKEELNSLRDLIKKLSFNLQQEEAENARMQASLQMKKFSSFWASTTPTNRKKDQTQKKGSTQHDYSSSPLSSDYSAT